MAYNNSSIAGEVQLRAMGKKLVNGGREGSYYYYLVAIISQSNDDVAIVKGWWGSIGEVFVVVVERKRFFISARYAQNNRPRDDSWLKVADDPTGCR